MDGDQNEGPLSRLRVLDLTLFLSGPYATQVLGDLGAEVIKIEPKDGDNTRHLPPNFVRGDSSYFHSVNRNKKSTVIDYKTERGRALLYRLVEKCDIVIENLRPGALEKYGVTFEKMREANPAAIICSISGFGQDGPYRDRPAYDMVVQALSGGMSMTGERDGVSVRAGIPLADISAGLYGVIGILAALEKRHRTGEGSYVDISMLDCQVAMLSYQAAYYLASGTVPERQGRGHESIPSYRSFTARDGKDVVICANTDRMWRSLCKAVGLDDLGKDARLQDRRGRYAAREEIWAALEAAFLARDADDWVARLQDAEVPVGTVNTLDRTLSDPQVLHRGMVLGLEDGEARMEVAGNPIKMPGHERAQHSFPPRLAADTHWILGDVLGLSDEEIGSLAEAGIVGLPKDEA